MAEQRQPFRFRLPWLSAVTAPAPRPTAPQPSRPSAPQPSRPTTATQAPAQQTTNVPIQRPPFRPAGRAPTQAQIPPRVEPQLPSPSRVAPESRVASQPTSPSHATRAASVPPSPTRGRVTETRTDFQPTPTTRTQIPSETKSPPRPPTQFRAPSVPPSPSHTASQTQPAIQAEPQPRFPARLTSQPTGQTPAQPFSQLREPTQVRPTFRAFSQPPTPQKETSEPLQSLSREPQPQTQIKSEIVSESQYRTASETTFKPDRRAAAQPTQASGGQVTATTVAAPEPKRKSEDEKKAEKELMKEEKTNGSIDDGQGHRTVTEMLTAAGTRTKEFLGATFQSGEKKQEKQESFERKKPLTTYSSDEKQIKTVSSTPPSDRHTLGKTHQKLDTANGERAPLGSESTKKDGSVPIHRGYKLNSGDIPESATDGEGSSGGKKSDSRTQEDEARKAYINNNTQSITNSIMFESSVNERNPGVRMALSYNLAEPTNVKPDHLETHKAEFSVTQAEKLTYDPTIRRRCLRGLFMEPSDTDPDNPEKPRRHGCLYNSGAKSNDKDLGVL